MAVRKRKSTSVNLFSFVGNIGCIRFPLPIRKASGIKRGDRLAVIVRDNESILLVKHDQTEVPGKVQSAVDVEGCACMDPPESCGTGSPQTVTVGWSYVQLNSELAAQLGFFSETPIKLVAEPSRITVSLHHNAADLHGIPQVACPP